MKKLLLAVFIIGSGQLYAQDKSLDPLKAPAMPASSIIGAQSNEISRPKSLKGLETALLNNGLSENGLVMPNSFAIELNPYMLGPRKNFDYTVYIKSNDEVSVLETMAQNFSVSLSTTQSFNVNANQSVNAAGYGVRTIILNGKPNPQVAKAFKNSLDKNDEFLKTSGQVNTLVGHFIDDNSETKVDDLVESLNIWFDKNEFKENKNGEYIYDRKSFNVLINIIKDIPNTKNREEIENLVNKKFTASEGIPNFKKLQALLHNVKMNRYGLRWDVQAAVGTVFPTNDFSYSIVPRWGIWSNLSYRPLMGKLGKDDKGEIFVSKFEFIGMFRLLQNNNDFYRQFAPGDSTFKAGNFIDLGGRVVYDYKQFSLEAEVIYRINSTESAVELVRQNSTKYLVNINYNIKDNVIISYYIGKEFDQAMLANGDLISGLSLNFGFGDMKLSDLANK